MDPARARVQQGFTVIEVVVAAMLVVLVGLGVFAGLDFTSRASGNARSRSLAFTLAQREQTCLRSRPASSLLGTISTCSGSAPAGYTLSSSGRAIGDPNGGQGCTAGGNGFVQVQTEVTYPNEGVRLPIRLHTLVARPFTDTGSATGSAVLILDDSLGNPLPNIATTLSGPSPRTPTTDANGCAFETGLTPGSYTFTVTKANYVGPDGGSLSVAANVAAQQLATVTGTFDRAGTAPIAVWTRRAGAGSDIASTPASLTLGQTGLSGGSKVVAVSSATPTLGNLFPFTGGYKVNTGDCPANALGTPPAGRVNAFTVGPGQTLPTVNIFQPSIDVTAIVPAGYASYWASAVAHNVTFTPTDGGCSTKLVRPLQNSGKLADADMGLPYGTYNVCIDAKLPNGSGGWIFAQGTASNVANTSNAGTPVSITYGTTPTAGMCP
jgi:hypothetical protein